MVLNSEISNLKRQIGVYDLALSEGLQLTKVSLGTYRCLCVFHTEKTPSLTFFTKTNTYKCFGCGRGGDVINYLMDRRGVSMKEAIRILRTMSPTFPFKAITATYKNGGHMKNGNGEPRSGAPPGNDESAAPGVGAPDAANDSNGLGTYRLVPENQRALRLYIEYCHRALKASQLAIDYLMKRGLRFGELIDEFLVGFVDGSALEKLTADKDIARALFKIGVLKLEAGKVVERFAGCIVFPIINTDGVITGIYARRIAGEGSRHELLPGGHQGFFNPRALIAKEVIVTESIIDALSLMTLGYRNVIASYGAQGFTDEIREALLSTGCEKLYVAFDADNGGNRGAEKIVEKLRGSAVQIYRVAFPDGFDPNDFIRKEHNAQALFKDLLLNSLLLYSSLAEKAEESAKEEKFTHSKTSDGEEFNFTSRKYLVRGLEDNKTAAALKVFIRAMNAVGFHHDSFDLYTDKNVDFFTKKAAEKLKVDMRILRTDLDALTLKLEEMRKNLLQKNTPGIDADGRFHRNLRMDKLAGEFLAETLLLVRFVEACAASGVVGEGLVCSICWAATFTRHAERPLHILIQSESSSGKSTIQLLTKDFTPPELLHYFTELSENTLYYQAEDAFWEVVIFIAEAEGIEKARFAIKQMMSDGILSKGSVQQDQKTGEFASIRKESRIRAPFIITLPKELEDEEFINRCLCLTLDESPEQTARIQDMQRRIYGPEGVKIRAARKHFAELFQHVQRLLEPLPVLNPYAEYFTITSAGRFGRRDLPKFMALCDAITFIHQKQRERVMHGGILHVRTHLIDVAIFYFMAKRGFSSTLDTLPPQGRKFFQEVLAFIKEIAAKDNIDIMSVEIYRKHVAEKLGKAPQRVQELFNLLERHEYVLFTRDRHGMRYRLHFRPDEDGNLTHKLALPPLSDIKKKASKKEREEYEAFIPQLKLIFKALDAKYEDGEF